MSTLCCIRYSSEENCCRRCGCWFMSWEK